MTFLEWLSIHWPEVTGFVIASTLILLSQFMRIYYAKKQ